MLQKQPNCTAGPSALGFNSDLLNIEAYAQNTSQLFFSRDEKEKAPEELISLIVEKLKPKLKSHQMKMIQLK